MDAINNTPLPDKNVSSDNNLPPPRLDPVQPAMPSSPAPTPTISPMQPAAVSNTPAIADDADLIEKEWVVKAKHIVEQTKNDPHLRNQEINKIKADYIKKRYNKDIQTTGD